MCFCYTVEPNDVDKVYCIYSGKDQQAPVKATVLAGLKNNLMVCNAKIIKRVARHIVFIHWFVLLKEHGSVKSIPTWLLQERDAYLPLAQNGSRLFFVISDLAKINNMYRFSLAAFLRLFQRSLDIDNSTGSMDMRIKSLNGCLQKLVYEYVCR